MVREFSEEKRQEIFRLLDEIDNREWKSFMEWCGSSAEEFGDWPDKLAVSAYTRYVDKYHERVLETNEMTRNRVNTVFENVAEIDTRYAGRMRECQEKIKEQISLVRTMTEFMQSMTDGNPNMALITKGNVNDTSIRLERENTMEQSMDGAENPEEQEISDSAEETPGFLDFLQGRAEGIDSTTSKEEINNWFKDGLINDEQYRYFKQVINWISCNSLPSSVVDEIKVQVRLEFLKIYVNENTLTELGWDIDAAKKNIDENFIEEMRELMLEYGLTDEKSIILFLITITQECHGGRSMLEYGNEEYFDGQNYSDSEKGAGLLQLTLEANQIAFLKYITGRTEEEGFDDLLGSKSMAEYISINYPIESALWFWCVYDDKITFNGEHHSINYAIEQYGNNSNLYAMFIGVQCVVNRSGYGARGCGRMFLPENEVYYEDGKIYLSYYEDSQKITVDDDDVPIGMEERVDLYNSHINYFKIF